MKEKIENPYTSCSKIKSLSEGIVSSVRKRLNEVFSLNENERFRINHLMSPDKMDEVDKGHLEAIENALHEMIRNSKSNHDLIRKIRKILNEIESYGIEIPLNVKDSLNGMIGKNEEEKMFHLSPLIRYFIDNPNLKEEIMRVEYRRKYREVNSMLFYGIDKDNMHLHIAPDSTIDRNKKFNHIKQGLNKLANIVDADPGISKLTATSWIVAKNPSMMKKLGFNLEGDISDEFQKEHFDGDKRNIAYSFISREDFLRLYS